MQGPEATPRPPGPAIVLLSGGLDSCVAAALALQAGFRLHALSFDYGQRHRRELEAAAAIGRELRIADHRVLPVPLGSLGGSALTDKAMTVPDAGTHIGAAIPTTYVPARNTVFLSLGLAAAETVGADVLVIGANALDYSGYPDCRPEYLAAFEAMATLATKRGVEGHPFRVWAPLLRMSKADIVRAGVAAGAPLHLSWSCYRGGDRPCGTCESCVLRARGFREAGMTDPALAAGGAGQPTGAGGFPPARASHPAAPGSSAAPAGRKEGRA